MPDDDEDDALPPGRWVRTGLIVTFVPDKKRRPPAECGTRSGYQRHRRNREQACVDCLAAYAKARREYVARTVGVREKLPCGTLAAYRRHRRKREDACAPCKAAAAAYEREKKAKREARQRLDTAC